MRLNNNTRVFFEPTSHTYLLDDETLLIGVTSLLKKHNLSANYANISKEVLDNAAAIGTSIHKEIEDYDNGNAVVLTPLLKQYRKLKLKHIASEYLVSDNQTAASSIDGVYQGSSKNSVILVDYKSTNKVHTRPLQWQVGIYKVWFERQNPGITVEACFCLHIDKYKREINGLIPITPVTEEEVDGLLQAEREGLVYIDTFEAPEASVVLEQNDLSLYIESQSRVRELKAQLKQIEAKISEWDAKVLSFMLDNNIERMKAGDGEFSIKKASVRESIDTKALKEAHPRIFKKFYKEVIVKPSLLYNIKKS